MDGCEIIMDIPIGTRVLIKRNIKSLPNINLTPAMHKYLGTTAIVIGVDIKINGEKHYALETLNKEPIGAPNINTYFSGGNIKGYWLWDSSWLEIVPCLSARIPKKVNLSGFKGL